MTTRALGRRHPIRSLLVAVALVAPGAAFAQLTLPSGNIPPAPVGHLQPTTRSFTPDSTANAIEQQRLSTFDAKQQKLDDMLDKKLNICRC